MIIHKMQLTHLFVNRTCRLVGVAMVAVCACVSGLADAVPQGRALNNFVRELIAASLKDGALRWDDLEENVRDARVFRADRCA